MNTPIKRTTLPLYNKREGFSLLETVIVIAIIILMVSVSVPYLRDYISSQRLQEVAWQMVQDLRTVKESAILYQQDLNVYINYNNTPVEPTNPQNKNNKSYLFETFQYNNLASPPQHYIPGDSQDSHFTERILKYNIVINSITSGSSSSIVFNSRNYFVICFRSGAGSTFRGEADVVTAMDTGNRTNSNLSIVDSSKLVIELKDTSTNKTFYVIVDGTGKISMNGKRP